VLDSGAFRDVPGLIELYCYYRAASYKSQGCVSLYNRYTLEVTNI